MTEHHLRREVERLQGEVERLENENNWLVIRLNALEATVNGNVAAYQRWQQEFPEDRSTITVPLFDRGREGS